MVANINLLTLGNAVSVLIQPRVHRRLLSTSTDRFNLNDVVRPGKEIFTSFKRFALEICPDSVTENRNRKLVAYKRKLQKLEAR